MPFFLTKKIEECIPLLLEFSVSFLPKEEAACCKGETPAIT